VVREFAEYSGRPVEEIMAAMKSARALTRADFTGRRDPADFYAHSDTYIYDLLSSNWSPAVTARVLETFLPGLLCLIAAHPGKRLLEFGGGTGVFSGIASRDLGKRVTYVDLESPVSRFARWRFARHGLGVDVRIVPPDDFRLPGTYDVVYSDAVLEHLPAEQQLRYAAKLAALVDERGLLILLVDPTGHQEDVPMHHDVDLRALHDAVEGQGLGCHLGRDGFASIWGRGLPPLLTARIAWMRWRRWIRRRRGQERLDELVRVLERA
jgi:protein-L-isoaspartate O-methyltransferase